MRESRTKRRRGFVAAIVATALVVGGLGVAPAASDEHFVMGSMAPRAGFEQYAGCPVLAAGAGNPRLCLAITINGTIELGDVGGDIEDMTIILAVGTEEGAVIPAPGGGGPADVPVSGGILGIPALDPVLELDVLQLLSLSATPIMGDLEQTGLDDLITIGVFQFLGNEVGPGDDPFPLPPAGGELCGPLIPGLCFPYPEIGIGLPLTLELNNLLLGDDCSIGPVALEMTTGTTSPPEGTDPLTGSSGFLTRNGQDPDAGSMFEIDGMEFVGNAYDVPEADCPGIVGAGDLLEELGQGIVNNPFEALINGQAGLPSPAGNNTARLSVGLNVAMQDQVFGTRLGFDPAPADFGEVAIGDSSTLPVTVTNNRPVEQDFTTLFTSGQFSVDRGTCVVGIILQPAETCQIEVTFSPTGSPGVRNGSIQWNNSLEGGGGSSPLTGVAI